MEKEEIRKAGELEDVMDLNFSPETLEEVKRMHLSTEALVLHGRSIALSYQKNPRKKQEDSATNRSLVEALDKAGYIRHDLAPATCIVWRLYYEIQPDITIKRICFSNEQYEEMEAVSDDQHRKVVETVMSLPDDEGKVLLGLYALEGGTKQTLKKVAKTLETSPETVKKIERQALRDLKKPNYLIKLPEILGWENRKTPNLAFYRGTATPEKKTRLSEFYWESGTTYQALLDNEIYTVGDVLRFPKKDWEKMRNPKVLANVEDVMHQMGFYDFSTS